MGKIFSFFLIIVFILNNFSVLSTCDKVGQEEFAKIMEIQAPLIGAATACSLPIEIMKRIMGQENAATNSGQNDSKDKDNQKQSKAEDFSINVFDNKIFISKITGNSTGFLVVKNAASNGIIETLNSRGQPIGTPFDKHRNILLIFILAYLVLLALKNLPDNAMVFVKNRTRP